MVEGPAPLRIPNLHSAQEDAKSFMRPVLKLKETVVSSEKHLYTQKLVSLSEPSQLV